MYIYTHLHLHEFHYISLGLFLYYHIDENLYRCSIGTNNI